MVTSFIPDRGDIIWLNFNPQTGHEQKGRRSALVISAKAYNKSGLLLACPITSKVKHYPFEIEINSKKIQGAVLADHVKNLDWKSRKAKFICKADKKVLEDVQKTVIAIMLN